MKNIIINFLIGISVIFSVTECTKNPLDDDSITLDEHNKIYGTLRLSDKSNPEGTFVWLEGFDLSTYIDKNGYFKIRLPAPQLQPGGGITGSFKVYYFLSNYLLDSSFVVIENGQLQPLHGDIGKNGELKQQKVLLKKLNIRITVKPAIVVEDYEETITIGLHLNSAEDTTFIDYPDKSTGPLSILFFKNLDAPNQDVLMFENNSYSINAPHYADSITVEGKYWETGFKFSQLNLAPGKYEIIPYFIIKHKYIPVQLLNNFGDEIYEPVPDFVNIPTKRNSAVIKVNENDVVP